MQHCFRTSFVVLVLILLVDARFAIAQTAQFTINGIPVTVPLKPNGSGGWVGSGLSPLPNNIVVGFSSVTDSFLRSTSLTVTLQGQGTGAAISVSVLFSAPMSLPAGPTVVTSQASGANIGSVGVSMAGDVSANGGATYQNMGVDLNTPVSRGTVTVGPQTGPNSPPFNFMRVTGTFSLQGGEILNTSAQFTIQPGALGSPAPTAENSHANGAGRFTSLLAGPVQFTLDSVQHKDGTVRGTLSYQELDQDFGVLVAVECLNVVGNRAVVTGTIVGVGNPDFSEFVGLPAAFSVRDEGRGRKATPDLASDLWVLFEDCFDPAVIQLTEPFSPLEGGNVTVKSHTPK